MTRLPPKPRDGHPRASAQPWRRRLHEVIFEADTPAGKAFDVALLIAILLSVLAVMLESVGEIRDAYGSRLLAIEWLFTCCSRSSTRRPRRTEVARRSPSSSAW